MSSRSDKLMRSIGAYACLAAAILLCAPQAIIGWWAGTGACCKSDYCPIPEHHRPKQATAAHHRMECEHDAGDSGAGKAGLAACGMSCCHDTERALMTPVVFVLDTGTEPQGLSCIVRVSAAPSGKDILQDSKPLSPPPRF